MLLNRSGGSLRRDPGLVEQVRVAFAEAGIDAVIEVLESDELLARAETLIAQENLDALAIGGGDGTIGAVAALLAGKAMSLGVLPLGTLNHFARDAGIPADVKGSVGVIAAGHAADVDLAEVNGRVFVNNSSVGLYPLMVRDRERQQEHLGRGKWTAMARAAARAIWRLSKWRLRITADGEVLRLETPILFVGNNRYETGFFGLGTRTSLSGGELCLYAIRAHTRTGLAGAVLRALAGRLDRSRDFVIIEGVSEARVDSRRTRLHVAADGEAFVLETPLCYRTRPNALKLLVPLASEVGAS